MKITVLGIGHVGLVTAATMADLGHDVVGYDVDESKVAAVEAGTTPFHEPGLDELLQAGIAAGRLTVTTDREQAIVGADVVFICVGTPGLPHGGPNLSYVQDAAATIARVATGPVVVAEKSTVPVQTGARIRQALSLEKSARDLDVAMSVVSNPEFLREGSAVVDTLEPDRIVVGADDEHGHEVMRRVYAPLLARHDCPYVATDVATAELIKHASNAFLATKISFINAVAEICERSGADVEVVADAMGHDARIGRAFLNAGIGYGGSCFPKDVRAFDRIAAELGYDFGLLRETDRINRDARDWPLRKLREHVWNVAGKTVAVLGVAFKPGTDDIREAPALDIVDELVAEGAHVRLTDPVALPRVEGRWERGVDLVADVEDAVRGAHAVILATEWPQYGDITPDQLKDWLEYPVVVDGRNLWDLEALRDVGLHASQVGRA